MNNVLDKITVEWKAALALGSAFLAGTAVALVLAGWVELPLQVEQHGDAITQMQDEQAELRRNYATLTQDMRWIRCAISAMAIGADLIDRCGL